MIQMQVVKIKGKVVLVLRRMWEWRYSSTHSLSRH